MDDLTKLASGISELWDKFLNDPKKPLSDCDLTNAPIVHAKSKGYIRIANDLYYIYDTDLYHEPVEAPTFEIGDYYFVPSYINFDIKGLPSFEISALRRELGEDKWALLGSKKIKGWTYQMKSSNGEDECRPKYFMDPFLVDAKGTWHIVVPA